MIKNFNFYDVYGFLLPGIIVVALLWLPFGLIENEWPEAKVASALIAVIFGYIAGHILQTIAANIFNSTIKDKSGKSRYPSNVFLDKDNSAFSSEFKDRLSERIRTLFNIDVNVESSAKEVGTTQDIDRRRRDAFLLCRSVLIKSKTVSYAEQHEGMYAMMRGLSLAFILGLVYNAGWASTGLIDEGVESRYWIALASGFAVAIIASVFSISYRNEDFGVRFKNSLWIVVSLCVALAALGNHLGHHKLPNDGQRVLLSAIVLGSLFAALRCYGAFREHAEYFAKAVYRDFYIYEKSEGSAKEGSANNSGAEEDKDDED
jgi:hypothetical protein